MNICDIILSTISKNLVLKTSPKNVSQIETNQGEIMVKFKKSDIISYVLENHPNAEEILTNFGFHCLYCPCSQAETLEEACQVHEVDVELLLKELNKEIKQ